MSNEEVICTFMEAKPAPDETSHRDGWSIGGWWRWNSAAILPEDVWRPALKFRPEKEHLGWISEVEANLSAEQWRAYYMEFWCRWIDSCGGKKDLTYDSILFSRTLLHASAEQKIQALGEVLGREVER